MCFSIKISNTNKSNLNTLLNNRRNKTPLSFNLTERQQLKKNFQKFSSNKHFISKQLFKQKIGVLGLKVASKFADRLFNAFDLDEDQYINFDDFIQYMDIIKNGDFSDKALISFRMIKLDRSKKYFTKKDFELFLKDYLQTWSHMTYHHISRQMNQRNQKYIQKIFNEVKQKKKDELIDFQYYRDNLYKNELFNFGFITQGVKNLFGNQSTKKQKKMQKSFVQIQQNLEKMYQIYSEQQENTDDDIGQQSKPNDIYKFQKQDFNFENEISIDPKKTQTKNIQQNYDIDTLSNKSTQLNSFNQIQKAYQKKVISLRKQLYGLIVKIKQIRQQLQQQESQIPNQLKQNTIANVHKTHLQQQGKMIFIGDQNWNLVLNMMIGMQMAIKTVNTYQNQQLFFQQPKDFQLKYYFQLIPKRFGGDKNQNLSTIYKFTDYAPNTFNHIRRIFGINNQEYIKSIGTQKMLASLLMGQASSLSELTSQGKSGSFFYYTANGQFMLKTIHHKQYKFLKQILQDYYHHLINNKNSLMTKFFGLHRLIQRSQTGQTLKKYYFVIMANVFNTSQKIMQRYDIKGSSYGRNANDNDIKATKKDNDFLLRNAIKLKNADRLNILNLIRGDVQFFENHSIIDYSLLIGVIKNSQNKIFTNQKQQLTAKIYQSVEQKSQKYVFGIIDILTFYDTKKKMQYCFKKTLYGDGVSAVPPNQYSERFYNFVDKKVFK